MSPEGIPSFIFKAFTLVLPIFCAGLVLIWVLRRDYLARLDTPLDRGMSMNGKRVFGDNKTWRGIGIYFAIATAICIVLWLSSTRYPYLVHPIFSLNPFLIGAAFSTSYVLGELTNSFVKRRLGISPGRHSGSKTQTVLDNIDGILFVVLALFIFFNVAATYLIAAACIGAMIHKGTDILMVRLGLK